MRLIADFHIHSHFSRATTPQLTPENLDHWGRIKGLQVIGTGDCVHPGWLAELREALEPAEEGLYRLKAARRTKASAGSRLSDEPMRFMLTTEISSIYKKRGRVRKVHTICVLPDLDAAQRLHERLAAIGNVRSDGRPILGLDAKHLLEIVLEVSPDAYVIPAHIWTPWFSVLGSQSGFDSLEECFDDLTPHIFAVETGLSSDPAMNQLCGFLDGVRLVSNSDAHSPEKLGREANLFDTELSFRGVRDALKRNRGFLGTIEFFPEEGKYHYDGHRKCGISWNPLTTLEHRGVCPVCHKPVTKGVLYRVAQLADRAGGEGVSTRVGGATDRSEDQAPVRQPYRSITPLPELVAQLLGRQGTASKSVKEEYLRLIQQLGSEFHILLFVELSEIARVGGDRLAEGIRRLREGQISAEAGYDGEFGKVRVFRDREATLFAGEASALPVYRSIDFDVAEFQRRWRAQRADEVAAPDVSTDNTGNDQQQEAIRADDGVCLVLAGPGSGKTYTLTERIAHLVQDRGVPPSQILALTFSNKAAESMRRRIASRLPDAASALTIGTLHALGLQILREHHERISRPAELLVLDQAQRHDVLAGVLGPSPRSALRRGFCEAGTAEQSKGERKRATAIEREVEAWKQGRLAQLSTDAAAVLPRYARALQEQGAVDFDDLIAQPVELLRRHSEIRRAYQARFRWLLVDEVQDLNARQAELIRLLLDDAQPNLFAIGDPDQAIYGFRGSDAGIIRRLQEEFPQARVIRLTRSYRCSETVLQAAGQVLQQPQPLRGATLELKIHIQQCRSERSEAEWIADRIEQLIGGTHSLSVQQGGGQAHEGIAGFRDFAVLARLNALLEPLAETLARRNIPVQLVGEDYDERAEGVALMTMHASKGLEFPAVFIAGCEEGLIPLERFGPLTDAQRAEEERLLYVAMTRSQRYLFLTHAQQRLLHGRPVRASRSRLLDRLERRLLELHKETRPRAPKPEYRQHVFATMTP